MFVGGTRASDFHGSSHSERSAPLGACRNIPCLTPTLAGCEGLTKERYQAEVQLVWGDLEGLLRDCPTGDYCAVFSRRFDDARLRWYNCFLTMNELGNVVTKRAQVGEAVVNCAVGLSSYASIHARRSDGSQKFACVPCSVLRRARDSLSWNCETLRALLPKADIVFAPVSLSGRFTLLRCDKVKRILSYFDPSPIEDEEDADNMWETFTSNARALLFALGCHGMPTTFAEWQMRLLPCYVEVSEDAEAAVAPPNCPLPATHDDSAMYVIATVERLVCGQHPIAIREDPPGYPSMYNYRKHVMWLLMHWHLHGVWPGYVGDWCADP
jgi:hypothetical protein